MIHGEHGYIGRNLKALLGAGDFVVNCIGKKDLHWCEDRPSEAYFSNAIVAGKLARLHKGERFIQIGSDHAYALGNAGKTVYARSKALGDELVLAEHPKAVVVITGHVYAADCPWVRWLDGELQAGRRVVAYRNRVCCPTWMGDLAEACKQVIGNAFFGRVFVTGRDKVDRYQLYRAYAEVFGYDPDLIAAGEETDPVLIGDMSVGSDFTCLGVREGFEKMKKSLAISESVVILKA